MNYFNKKYCSPLTIQNFKNSGSCYSLSSLRIIALSYNKEHTTKKISNIKNKSKKQLVNELKKRLKDCKTEVCWKLKVKTNNVFINQFTHKPPGPKGRFAWLSTLNINNVLYQYTNAIKTFQFLGTFPSDYATKIKISPNISAHSVGIVFNIDPSTRPGKHWVALYIDRRAKTIEFFDSNGVSPQKEFRMLMKRLSNELGYKIKINRKRHQYNQSECGMYSIYFILQRLSGKSFEEINRKRIPDQFMNKLRNHYFLIL